jgi:hypothetical protein
MLLVGGSTVHAPTFFFKAGRPLEAKKISIMPISVIIVIKKQKQPLVFIVIKV